MDTHGVRAPFTQQLISTVSYLLRTPGVKDTFLHVPRTVSLTEVRLLQFCFMRLDTSFSVGHGLRHFG